MGKSTFKNYHATWEFLSKEQTEKLEKEHNTDEEWYYATEVKFYKDGEYMYSLEKNDYRTENDDFVLLEWFEHDGKTVFLFNLDHSVISVIDADTGKEIHHDNLFDVFIAEYQMFDNREYMYISGWFWSPLPVRVIYHIPTFLTTPNYKPIKISCYDQTDRYHPKIDLYGCDSAKEFVEQKDKIFKDMKIRDETNLFNKNRTRETLLHLFLQSEDVLFEENTKEQLSELLNKDSETFCIRTWGNVSGKHLSSYDRSLYKEILYVENDEKVAIPKNTPLPDPDYTGPRCLVCLEPLLKGYYGVDGGGVCDKDYHETVKQRSDAIKCKTSLSDPLGVLAPKIFFTGHITKLPLEEIDLRFELSNGLVINYRQELTWNGEELLPYDNGKRRCDIDPSKFPEIRVYQNTQPN